MSKSHISYGSEHLDLPELKRAAALDLMDAELRAVALSMPLFTGLTHVVQVKETRNGAEWWETIAAFNVERVAEASKLQRRIGHGNP